MASSCSSSQVDDSGVLHPLAPKQEYPPSILEIVSGWKKNIAQMVEDETQRDKKEQLSLLYNQLNYLRQPSISSRFIEFAEAHAPEEDNATYSPTIKLAYTLRSRLMHTGSRDEEKLSRAFPEVYDLLRRALKLRLT